MILNILQALKTYNKIISDKYLKVAFIFVLALCSANKSYAQPVPVEGLSYNTSKNTLNSPIFIKKEADNLFYKGIHLKDEKLKEAYLTKSLAKYMLLLSIQPNNVIFCTQVGVIHDTLNHQSQAKNYFFRALSLEKLNPFANFYYGEYYYNRKDYHNALKHYTIAFKNGYSSKFEVHNRLADIYEKLGDIAKAKDFYTVSLAANPSQKELNNKIISLNNVNYSKQDYSDNKIRE